MSRRSYNEQVCVIGEPTMEQAN